MEGNATLERLDDQLSWYSSRARSNQMYYKRLKVGEIAAAALVPAVGALSIAQGPAIASFLGAAIVVLEGIQHVYQYQANWIEYRATSEALKRECHLYSAKAGPYADTPRPDRVLAERIEELMSTEQRKWVQASGGRCPRPPGDRSLGGNPSGPQWRGFEAADGVLAVHAVRLDIHAKRLREHGLYGTAHLWPP